MQISEFYLKQIYKFFKQFELDEEGSEITKITLSNHQTVNHQDDIMLILAVTEERAYDYELESIIFLKYSDNNKIIVNDEKSIIVDSIKDNIYSHEKEIYDLFSDGGRMEISARYSSRTGCTVICIKDKEQTFHERFDIKDNKVHVKSVVEEDVIINFKEDN